jgi:hypothetical protein
MGLRPAEEHEEAEEYEEHVRVGDCERKFLI